MRFSRFTLVGVIVVAAGRILLRRRRSTPVPAPRPEQAHRLLERIAPLLRLPTSPDQPPIVLPDGSGLRCPTTGMIYPYRDGILDVLPHRIALTQTQRALDTALTSWVYDRTRDAIMMWFGLPSFAAEVGLTQRLLQVRPGDTVLDVACGHGNFTVEWAKRAGDDGFVIGLDISTAMLSRAAHRIHEWDLHNVLLIHGDAHQLPFATESLQKVNCSGGFHQLPNIAVALGEIARVSQPSAVLTASTFAEGENDPRRRFKRAFRRFDLNFIPLGWLGEQLAAVGYDDYTSALTGGWFGYLSARKR